VATTTETKTLTFHSKHGALRLPRVKQVNRLDQLGNQHAHVYFKDENNVDISRRVYEFENGTLTLREGQDVYPDGPGGVEQDAVTWLRAHPEYNGRFFESGNEPDRPLPSDDDFHRNLRRHLLALDHDSVVGMLKQERETHARPVLLTAADETRREILALRAQIDAESSEKPPETPPEAA
jgi:hypothetical protein